MFEIIAIIIACVGMFILLVGFAFYFKSPNKSKVMENMNVSKPDDVESSKEELKKAIDKANESLVKASTEHSKKKNAKVGSQEFNETLDSVVKAQVATDKAVDAFDKYKKTEINKEKNTDEPLSAKKNKA